MSIVKPEDGTEIYVSAWAPEACGALCSARGLAQQSSARPPARVARQPGGRVREAISETDLREDPKRITIPTLALLDDDKIVPLETTSNAAVTPLPKENRESHRRRAVSTRRTSSSEELPATLES